jgi:hypothetical protein
MFANLRHLSVRSCSILTRIDGRVGELGERQSGRQDQNASLIVRVLGRSALEQMETTLPTW